MPYLIIRADIAHLPDDRKVDAIVTLARRDPREIGTGVDNAVHKAAGPLLLGRRKLQGAIATGAAKITPSFDLKNADYIIHTVPPMREEHDAEQLLKQCYTNSLECALENKCKSIAFPLIGTGNLGFTEKSAYQIAVNAFTEFCEEYDMDILLVVLKEEAYSFCKRMHNVQTAIDEASAKEVKDKSYTIDGIYISPSETHKRIGEVRLTSSELLKYEIDETLEETSTATFSETLNKLIECVKKDDPQIYQKAHLNESAFNKIRNHKQQNPKKTTVVALAMSLELNLHQTQALLERAGYKLHESRPFDKIIMECISKRQYDICSINEMLAKAGLKQLGSW